MSKLNIEEWTVEDVADWMSGLEPVVVQYIPLLKEKGVNGRKLLNLRCDDLEYLGVHVIGHQELFLEAVEKLRHFQYESRRECIQQLAVRVSVTARTVSRALARASRIQPAAPATAPATSPATASAAAAAPRVDTRLSTQALADVARLVAAVKPLVSWIDSWNIWWEAGGGAEGRGALLRLALEAALAATRERFAEQPARAAASAAHCLHLRARALIQDVVDWRLIQPAAIEASSMRLEHSHTDTIIQVEGRVVLGWAGAGGRGAGGRGVWLRRAPPRPAPHPRRQRHPILEEVEVEAEAPPARASSDESEAPSSPRAPSHPATRLFPPKPRGFLRRRHTIAGDRIARLRLPLHPKQFWHDFNSPQWLDGGSGDIPPTEGEEDPLYRRDKALSCSTGLEMSPRPNTCLGVSDNHPIIKRLKQQQDKVIDEDAKNRGKLDKSHSTPAYDFNNSIDEQPSLITQIIPESPTTPNDSPTIIVHSAEKADQILGFKKSSTKIEEAILHQQNKRTTNGDETSKFSFEIDEKDGEENVDKVLETINIAIIEHKKESKSNKFPAENSQSKIFSMNEHIKTIQNEMIQAITKSKIDAPPEPPPRPMSTQKIIIKEPTQNSPNDHKDTPISKPVKKPDPEERFSPLRPLRNLDASQISLPLKHLTKQDIHVISTERRELPPLNSECLNVSQVDLTQTSTSHKHETRSLTLSPTTASVVKGMFPSAKTKSLKKMNSLLARRRVVPCAEAARCGVQCGWLQLRARRGAGGAGGAAGGTGGWAARYLVLTAGALLAYCSPGAARAVCMMRVAGAVAGEAREVRSRPHAFKLYRAQHALYCAAPSHEDMRAWLSALAAATQAAPPPATLELDESQQFSETSCSDDSDEERRKEKEIEANKQGDKDKSKFNSLKKLTHRMQRSESHEAVSGGSSSLDRKYLRFFTRHKQDKNKNKLSPTPVPTEHYRSYRRVQQSDLSLSPTTSEKENHTLPTSPVSDSKNKKLPKPINYIHASNPNLVDFEKSDFVTKPNVLIPKTKKPDNFVGFVTLEEFMLKKQEEERQQVYTNRVLMGIERDKKDLANSKKAAKELQKQLDKIVPDVIYGELPTYPDDQLPLPVVEQIQSRTLPKTPDRLKVTQKEDNIIPDGAIPVSVKGKDGYEKIVYAIGDKSPKNNNEPPKVLPRKPVFKNPPDIKPPPRSETTALTDPHTRRDMELKLTKTSEIRRKSSLTAKDLGYELLYDVKTTDSSSLTEASVLPSNSAVNLGYEKIYDENFAKAVVSERRASEGKPAPPKIMPKSRQVLNRQSSLTSGGGGGVGSGGGGGGVDSSPVFLQGESPEKFWLNSLRRNDKVHQGGSSPVHVAPSPPPAVRSTNNKVESDAEFPSSPQWSGGAGGASISRLRQMFSKPADTPTQAQESGTSGGRYAHLPCPPTFQAETYSLQPPAPAPRPPPPPHTHTHTHTHT